MKPLSDKCKAGSCPHPKCASCEDCVRYHIFKKECGKIFPTLHTCRCKRFVGKSEKKV